MKKQLIVVWCLVTMITVLVPGGIRPTTAKIACSQSGGTWTVESNPITDTRWGLYSVAMISSSDGWAVGNKGAAPNGYPYGPFILHWNGNVWSQVSISDTASSYGLNSVAMVSANDGWAVGYGGILHWNGNNWIQATSPVTYTLNSVTMVSSNDGWAVGDSGTILHWNGNTWNQMNSPVTQTLESVVMISDNEGWAVGASGVILHYMNSKRLYLPLIVR